MVTYVYHWPEHLSTSEGAPSDRDRLARTRVQGVAQAVADEGKAEHEESDGPRREQHHPDVHPDEAVAVGDQPPQARRGRGNAEADEAQDRLGEDSQWDAEGHGHDDWAQSIRQHMLDHDAER